jgi:acyl-homoserine-lactone acylase
LRASIFKLQSAAPLAIKSYFYIMIKTVLLFFLPLQIFAQPFSSKEISVWEQQSKNVTIIRDNYGIPHIYGKTDADAVFGLMYAQCEDDFKRVEMNYIEKLGRMSEVKGEGSLYDDLLIRMIIDADDAKKDYGKSPPWLKKLCIAFADGINYYLYKHPETKPALLTKFQPWYPLLWTDGSIGAINTAGLDATDLTNLYSGGDSVSVLIKKETEEVLTGSNGFAFSPKITESGNSILYINPHVTFYFRPEVHMVSEEACPTDPVRRGLNAYGAVTWGQFFVYQGFNENCGWMHTSSDVDAADTYIEKISKKGNGWVYEYEGKQKPVTTKKIFISYKNDLPYEQGKKFTVLFSHHGPVMAKKNGEWLSVRADNRNMNGLIQCWQRTKAKGLDDFKKTLDLKGNISNNTVYADAQGNIAYWHGNRIPARNVKYDWSKPVDGSITATEWKGYHNSSEIVQSINPLNGWLQNCNSTPFTVAGSNSPKKENYPVYMAPDKENFRGLNAVRVLSEEKKYNLDKVIKAGYDTRLTAFEVLIPALLKAFTKSTAENESAYAGMNEVIDVFRSWDYRCSEKSIATTLAILWGEKLIPVINKIKKGEDLVEKTKYFADHSLPDELLQPLLKVVVEMKTNFGNWQIPWGEVNRFQRISTDINNKFDDSKPSLPVGFASATWGMLPSYTSRMFPGTKKRYGVNGNSFICAVELGKKIKAKSLLAGGQSGNENSKHFFDQGEMYSKGIFKEVLFYKEDVMKYAEKSYHPGE